MFVVMIFFASFYNLCRRAEFRGYLSWNIRVMEWCVNYQLSLVKVLTKHLCGRAAQRILPEVCLFSSMRLKSRIDSAVSQVISDRFWTCKSIIETFFNWKKMFRIYIIYEFLLSTHNDYERINASFSNVIDTTYTQRYKNFPPAESSARVLAQRCRIILSTFPCTQTRFEKRKREKTKWFWLITPKERGISKHQKKLFSVRKKKCFISREPSPPPIPRRQLFSS